MKTQSHMVKDLEPDDSPIRTPRLADLEKLEKGME